MNLVVEQGRLTKMPELRYTVDGVAIVRINIAVAKKVLKGNGPTADFFDCACFGKLAENIRKNFSVGDMILVKGRLENDNYINREGKRVYGNVIIVEEWGFGPKKRETL